MSPSRRRLLRSVGLSLAALGGCSLGGETPTPSGTQTGTSTPSGTPTGQPTATATEQPTTSEPTEPEPLSLCGHGPLPERGWPLPERSTGRTNYAPTAAGPTAAPTAAWTVTATRPEIGAVRFTRPTAADGRVHVGRVVTTGTEQPNPDQQYVHAYDAATGDRQWRAPVDGQPSAPAVDGGAAFVHDDATLYALDAATGEERWTHDPPGGVDGVLPTPDGVLVTSIRAGADDLVLAVESGGRVAWRVPVPGYVASAVAWVDGRAYVVTSDAVLVAVDTDEGTVAWTRDLVAADTTAPAAVAATPCAAFVAIEGGLHAVRRGGEHAWSVESAVRGLATDGVTVYGVDGSGHVRAVAADGEHRWERTYSAGGHPVEFDDGLALDGETLYAGADGRLFAVSTGDGSGRWTVERDWTDTPRASLADDALLTAWGRRLVAFR